MLQRAFLTPQSAALASATVCIPGMRVGSANWPHVKQQCFSLNVLIVFALLFCGVQVTYKEYDWSLNIRSEEDGHH